MATVSCPSCGRALEVEDEYRDWTVRCPHCEHEFVPSEVAPAELEMEDEPAPRRRRRRRYDDDEDYEEDRPRRRRRRYADDDYDDERDTRDEAATMVSAPAMWLEICGWGGAVLTVGICLILLAIGAERMNNPPRNNANGDPAEFFLFLSCCIGVLGLPYSVAMAIGARKMRNLTGRGWAMTSAILGVASIALFGLLGIIQTAIGIWALVVLNNPIVSQAFS
ncbi:MAG: hypothetical protein L0241_08730, partial [Planctomycetia bacterium]|nr:hypothetical protein [Planctomycetia bacterium]